MLPTRFALGFALPLPGPTLTCVACALKGPIERLPRTHRYRVTAYGRRAATFFTRLLAHMVVPDLTETRSRKGRRNRRCAGR